MSFRFVEKHKGTNFMSTDIDAITTYSQARIEAFLSDPWMGECLAYRISEMQERVDREGWNGVFGSTLRHYAAMPVLHFVLVETVLFRSASFGVRFRAVLAWLLIAQLGRWLDGAPRLSMIDDRFFRAVIDREAAMALLRKRAFFDKV